MFENPRRGRQARNFTTNVPKILDLKSSSEQIFSRKLPLGAPVSCGIFLNGERQHCKWFCDTYVLGCCQNIFVMTPEFGAILKMGRLFPEAQPLTLLIYLSTIPVSFTEKYRFHLHTFKSF